VTPAASSTPWSSCPRPPRARRSCCASAWSATTSRRRPSRRPVDRQRPGPVRHRGLPARSRPARLHRGRLVPASGSLRCPARVPERARTGGDRVRERRPLHGRRRVRRKRILHQRPAGIRASGGLRSDDDVDHAELAAGPGASGYDVVAGDLGTMSASAGDFQTATTTCLAEDQPPTTLDHSAVLPAAARAPSSWRVRSTAAAQGPTTATTGRPPARRRDRERAATCGTSCIAGRCVAGDTFAGVCAEDPCVAQVCAVDPGAARRPGRICVSEVRSVCAA